MNKTASWEIGKQVKIGFLTLIYLGVKENEKSALYHNIHKLVSAKGQKYEFSAYEGLQKVSTF